MENGNMSKKAPISGNKGKTKNVNNLEYSVVDKKYV